MLDKIVQFFRVVLARIPNCTDLLQTTGALPCRQVSWRVSRPCSFRLQTSHSHDESVLQTCWWSSRKSVAVLVTPTPQPANSHQVASLFVVVLSLRFILGSHEDWYTRQQATADIRLSLPISRVRVSLGWANQLSWSKHCCWPDFF